MSPGQVDRALVLRHLQSLEAGVRELEPYRGTSADELRRGPLLAWGVEHGLQLCAQNVLDIATHLAAAAGRSTDEYRSSIERLAEIGVLPGAFAASLGRLAGFRNILVHGYLDVDLEKVAQHLRDELDDFRAFAQHVEAYLARC